MNSTIFSANSMRFYLPRLRSLGSRLLNALVILALVLPNLTIAVQAAVPEAVFEVEANLPREDSVSLESFQPVELEEPSAVYQPPVFTHPQPGKGVELDVIKAPLEDPIDVSWDGGGGDSNWETANNWSNDAVPDGDSNVTIDANVTVRGNSPTTINALILGDSSGTYSPTFSFNYDAVSDGPLTVDDGDVVIHAGAQIIHTSAGTGEVINGKINLDIQSGNMVLDGTIFADQKGYRGAGGDYEDGEGPGGGTSYQWGRGDGAGYGDYGGGGGGGFPYGSHIDPLALGSGGGGSYNWASGGHGGGAIRINVAGTLTINGTITADGGNGGNNGWGAGGGSGGSIFINSGTITGTIPSSTITAEGGNSGDSSSGRGAGGRIALYYSAEYTFPGSVSAAQGSQL